MDERPSESLLLARRALEHVPFCRMLADLEWFSAVGKWGLLCRMTVELRGPLPETTDWHILIDADYPWGAIDCYPAKVGGIQWTFPHQSHNGEGDPQLPWRSGKVCVQTSLRTFGRRRYDMEPMTAGDRLGWHVSRLREWILAANDNSLVANGDPFELPDFPNIVASLEVAFLEDRESFGLWQQLDETVGTVDFVQIQNNQSVYLVSAFKDQRGSDLRKLAYGDVSVAKSTAGLWVKIPREPCMDPWQAPATMGELRALLKSMEIDLDGLLSRFGRSLRDGRPHFVMFGFPIPITVGGENALYHWQALMLPVLSHGKINGFRPIERVYSARDRLQITRDSTALQWVPSHNWSFSEISTRGRMSTELCSSRILVVGVGALGSMLAELLGRAGCSEFVVVDGERLQVGNLSRHTLQLSDVCTSKAAGIASRLRNIDPHARVHSIGLPFPATDEASKEALRDCKLVIDCTGDDTVLERMDRFDWQGDRLFVSASVGMHAKRLFLFFARGNHFPHDEFRRAVDPLITSELDEYGGEHLPREGIGCWHPVFPARADDLWAMASIAAKQIEEIMDDGHSFSGLRVFEQVFEGSQFFGIRRVL